MQRLAISSALLVAASCATGSDSGVAGGAPAAVTLTRVAPTVLLPRSVVIVEGVNLARDATHMLVLSGRGWLGAITPIGGLALIAGWLCLALAAWSAR